MPRHIRGRVGPSSCLAGYLVLVALAASAEAATFYVRTSGSDQNDGLSAATAFATIEHAAQSLVNAGDRVVVGPGTYEAANITPSWNGIEGHPIVFRADTTGAESGDPPGPVTIAVRQRPSELNSAFILYGRKHIVIDGFVITGASDPGIQIRPEPVRQEQSDAITLMNNEVRDGAKTGIEVQTTGDVTVQGNVVSMNQGAGISITGSKGGALLVEANQAIANLAAGIVIDDVSGGTIADNQVHNNDGVGILVRQSSSLVLRHNTVRSNGGGGIGVGVEPGLAGDCNRDGSVQMADLVDAVAIVLSQLSEGRCTGLSTNTDTAVDVVDLVAAVREAQTGVVTAGLGRDVSITGNTVEDHSHFGIVAVAKGELQAQGNAVHRNQTVGISLESDGDGEITVKSNQVASSGADGVLIARGAALLIDSNHIDASAENSIHILAGGELALTANLLTGSGKSGVVAEVAGNVSAADNTIATSGAVGLSLAAQVGSQITTVISGNGISGSHSDGMFVKDSVGGSVKNNTIADSGADGITILGAAVAAASGESLAIDSNHIDASGENGVRIVTAGGLALTRNRISGSGKSGVVAEAVGDVSLADNTVTTSGEVGVSVQAPMGKQITPVISGNQISGSHLGGMFVKGSVGASIRNNSLVGSGADGITIANSRAGSLIGNTLSGTTGHGIVIGSETDPGANFIVNANHVGTSAASGINLWGSNDAHAADNQVFDSGSAGISLRMLGPGATSTITGNTVGRSGADGVTLLGTVRATIQNNDLFSNGEAGLLLRGAPTSSVINNLVYANTRFGIAVGTGDNTTIASPDAVIASNTIYHNGQFGIVIGTAPVDTNGVPLPQSPGALIVDNALQGNGFNVTGNEDGGGIGVASGSLRGLVTGFNLNPDGYGDGIRVSPYDRFVDPAFVDPDGPDNILGGNGYEDDDFHLQQTPADQRSPGIDAGSGTAADIGITGSCLQGAGTDSGVIDVCYHYGAAADQSVHVSVPDLPMFTYVRSSGSAENDGLSPQRALGSILSAAENAVPGATVVVGPGRYNEGDLHIRNNVTDVTFLADPSGALTGDMPGPVVIDATGCQRCTETASGTQCRSCADTAFVLVDTARVTIDGFHITGTREGGIQVRAGSGGTVIRNNVVFSNQGRGIESFIGGAEVNPPPSPIDSVELTNNLVYANGSGGIRVNDTVNVVVLNNTVYGNGIVTEQSDAIHIGGNNDQVPTRGVVLMRNIVQANRDVGIKVEGTAREGYVTGYNVSLGLTNPLLAYAGNTPRADSDFLGDALLVNPAGADGVLGGSGFADDDFHLLQGGAVVSPAVDIDFAEIDALKNGTTSSAGTPDTGAADAGYHYPLPTPAPSPTP